MWVCIIMMQTMATHAPDVRGAEADEHHGEGDEHHEELRADGEESDAFPVIEEEGFVPCGGEGLLEAGLEDDGEK